METDGARASAEAISRLAAAPFLGREPQLSVGRTALDALRSGRGQALVLLGEAGIGKTRLADELLGLARSAGARCHRARCHDLEGAPALSPWLQIVRELLATLDERARADWLEHAGSGWSSLLPELASDRRSSSRRSRRPENEPDRHALFDALVDLLRRTARSAPLVVVLDDLHWADAASVQLVRYAIRELRSEAVALVGIYRDTEVDPGEPLARALADLSREAQVFRLSGLERADLGRLVEHVAGFSAPASVLDALRDQTGGNPFFLVEILRLLASEDRLGLLDAAEATSLPLPLTVRHTLERRLDGLADSARTILQQAAVFGREFELDLLEAALPAGAPIRRTLDESVHARLIHPGAGGVGLFRFAHDLIRETLESGLSLEARTHLHRSAGDAIVRCRRPRLDDYSAAISHHYLESATEGRAREAVEFALKGADRAAAGFSFELASGLYARALRALDLVDAASEEVSSESSALRAQTLVRLGDMAWRAGLRRRSVEANRAALEIARRIRDPELLGEAAIGLSDREDLQLDPNPAAVRLLSEALEAQPPGDSPLRVRLLAHLVHATGFADRHEEMLAWANEAGEIAARLRDDRARFVASEALHYALLRPVDLAARIPVVEEMLVLARRTGSRRFEAAALIRKVYDLLQIPDVVAADRALAAFVEAADRLRQPFYRWLASSLRATRAQIAGRLADAERLVFQTFELGQQAATPKAGLYLGGQLFQLRREQGRTAELLPIVTKIVEDDPNQTIRAAIPLIHVLCDRPDEARSTFEPIAARDFEDIPRDLLRLPTMAALATVAAYLGDRRRIEILRRELLADEGQIVVGGLLTYWEGSIDRQLGQLEEALGLFDDAVHHLESAARVAERVGAPLLEAHARLELARVLRARAGPGDPARSDDEESRARHCYAVHGIVGTPAVPTPLALRTAERDPAPIARSAPGRESTGEAGFARRGGLWELHYGGRSVSLPDSKGLAYVHFLLANVGDPVHVFDLIATEAPSAQSVRAEHRAASARRVTPGDAAPARLVEGPLDRLDDSARRDYRKRLIELAALRRDAEQDRDLARLEAIDREQEIIESELVAAYGLGGRIRSAASPLERARKAVYNRIRDAIKRVGEVHPELGRHLESSIRTGATCIYRPESDVDWNVG